MKKINCIFCKTDSTRSCSVEHIIPESIGNVEYTLPAGVVCDGCNNYFSTKVERPLLELPYFRDMCYRARIRNKKGNPPRVQGIHLQSLIPVDFVPDMEGTGPSIAATHPEDEKRWINFLGTHERGTLVVPVPIPPDEMMLSRFLAKVAMEVLAMRLLDVPDGISEIVNRRELDPLRNYARRGCGVRFWPFHKRQLYPYDLTFVESGSAPYEVLHEWTLLYTDHKELYLVLALFGVEYTLNMGGPELDGYKNWLRSNPNRSPLYPNGIEGTGPCLPPEA